MKLTLFCWFAALTSAVYGTSERAIDLAHESSNNSKQFQHIDSTYLINLDQRPEKWQSCLTQLQRYGITPQRFSAVYGWSVPVEKKNQLGVVFSPSMRHHEWASTYVEEGRGEKEFEFLRRDLYGKTVFSLWMSPGGIGCYLSHLQVLKEAFALGYETIWVLEDDILVKEDPHILDVFIEKLDTEVGKENWDVLYTDMDLSSDPYKENNDFISELKGDLFFFTRPDMNLDLKALRKRVCINEDFVAIGSRMRTHSMVIRRSGMKKIIDFVTRHGMFMPYDHDIAIVPGIELFNLRRDVVTTKDGLSDTLVCRFKKSEEKRIEARVSSQPWDEYKLKVQNRLEKIPGWKSLIRPKNLLDFIYEKKPSLCVEVGTFLGSTTFQIASALKFLGKGHLYSIDAWDNQTAVEGLTNQKKIRLWKEFNLASAQSYALDMIEKSELKGSCTLMKKNSTEAAHLFEDQSIDFLYLDGNSSSKGSTNDVVAYMPKVKPGGYIVMYNPDLTEKNASIALLMESAKWLKKESTGIDVLLFQKKESSPTESLRRDSIMLRME